MEPFSTPLPIDDLENKFLQEVSRSFALTIPLLPPPLGRTVANAYLLCRIVDTIEDDTALSVDQKHDFFRRFIEIIDPNRSASAESFSADVVPALSEQTLPAEKDASGTHRRYHADIFQLQRSAADGHPALHLENGHRDAWLSGAKEPQRSEATLRHGRLLLLRGRCGGRNAYRTVLRLFGRDCRSPETIADAGTLISDRVCR